MAQADDVSLSSPGLGLVGLISVLGLCGQEVLLVHIQLRRLCACLLHNAGIQALSRGPAAGALSCSCESSAEVYMGKELSTPS